MTIAALVPTREISAVRRNLAALDHNLRTSGPRPFPQQSRAYKPKFWIEAYGALDARYEALVLCWQSHDRTVFLPDPGFLMTYGLVPRVDDDGTTYWDDPTGPVPGVVQITTPSVYSFPNATPAHVKIARDYLQDYISLRKRVLVQPFWEVRYSSPDKEIDEKLGGRQFVDIEEPNRRLRIFRMPGGQAIHAEVSGARITAHPGPLPISDDPLEKHGLAWPGFDGEVTHARALALKPFESVYVDDRVLGDYEGRREYTIQPESGSVSFGTQWSVCYCDRVSRNLIRVELKKLYEGVPAAVTRNWHRFAVDPLPPTAYPQAREELNIAKRARALGRNLVRLGETLLCLRIRLGSIPLLPRTS